MFVHLGRAGLLNIWDLGCYDITRRETAGARCSMVCIRGRHDWPDRPYLSFTFYRVDRGGP